MKYAAHIFYLITVIITLVDLYFARASFLQKNRLGHQLSNVCICAALVGVTYALSTLPLSKFLVSLFSSLYFISIDLAVWTLLRFTSNFTREKDTGLRRAEHLGMFLFMLVDCTVLLINPFREIAVHYVFRDTPFAQYTYDMEWPYYMHLFFTYAMVLSVLLHLIAKAVQAPSSYKNPYILSTAGMVVIVACNAVFLFFPKDSLASFLDYSIWLYSLAELVFYWACFEYPKRGMLNPLRYRMMESISQGLVLFDYEDNLILSTDRAKNLLPGVCLDEGTALRDFTDSCGISVDAQNLNKNLTFQCFLQHDGASAALQCDYRPMLNDRMAILGRLFVFTDVEIETDPLTGFHNWQSFRASWGERKEYPMAVAICDINGLQSINSTYSHAEGDQAIKNLAEAMRRHFPKNAYFVRGTDARLIAFCQYTGEQTALGCLRKVQQDPSLVSSGGDRIHIQSAVSLVTRMQPDVDKAVSTAEASMRAKKMLDHNSSHSALMASLIRALQECDNDTEAHVQRTQVIGSVLGRRLGLTDAQLSDLSLLCILHDIGKIGIPLEILNKPGKLNAEEWAVLRSHVYKGYEIASSSKELNHIAGMILHHHERWDGMGYPDGLSKESIPLLSRVIAVVDAYDAMVNDRTYRSALPLEEACAELRRCAGSQFDPVIVSELLHLIAAGDIKAPEIREHSDVSTVRPQSRPVQAPSQHRVHPVRYARYILDADDFIISADDNFTRMTGYSADEIAEKHLRQIDLIPPEDRTEYLCLISEQLAGGDIAYFEHQLLRKDGSVLYVFCYGKRYYDSARRAGQSELIITDSASSYSVGLMLNEEQNKANNRLQFWEQKYRCDSLTGLLTHESFMNDVEERMLRGGQSVMMLMMDVDKFKEYNDTYGHRAGDEFLIVVAQAVTGGLRKDDLACRMGGDEFAAALFFDSSVSDSAMKERARQIFDKVAMVLSGQNGSTSLSMGVAISSGSHFSFNRLYEAADRCLYDAKRKGRSRMSVADTLTDSTQ